MAGAFGQQFDSSGSAVGEEFQINTYFTGSQAFPNAAMDADGDFVVAWHDGGQDGSNQGVFGRRFAFGGGGGITLDVDGNGEVGALTDGLLLLRWMFGFSGTTLTAGATGTGCTRCDGTTIASYIDSIASQLDVDDNSGEPDPLTDGLLILRRLFGFTGATLTTGALGNGCMRCDAGDIADYIDGLSM
jgi:hypothetical protein